jgi:glutamyl-Q tRNA(Asp) synthetase
MGSLIGALASYLDARSHQGQWLVRMEDLDPPREIAGAAQAILDCLQAHGLHWDNDVLWQSQRHQAYQQALNQLLTEDKAFYCSCSRSRLSTHSGIYNGHCRGCLTAPPQSHAIRAQVPDQLVSFDDAIQGRFEQQLEREVGDFVILRKDKLFAYQLAVVVDDAFQGITDIVRGSDLLDSTPRQIYLQQQLGLATPRYAHFPVIHNAEGQKLSKQTFACAIKPDEAAQNLLYALRFLQQSKPPHHRHTQDILEHAINHWQPQAIPACMAMVELPNGSFASSPVTQ